jgi:protein O-mannosyl-transferase
MRTFTSRWWIFAAAVAIALAVFAAYRNSFQGAFIYDDVVSIQDNMSIRNIGKIGDVLSPPARGQTVSGRPMLNLSFAVNYALGEMDPYGYHVANLVIHILAALALFGILRRTLLLPSMAPRYEGIALPLAFSVALIWAVHPLQTESVTYVAQRAESLMGLFYLLTIYCFIRGAAGQLASDGNASRPTSTIWYVLAAIACLLGMATKEVMLTAPLVLLLYDRTFLSGSFIRAIRQRWGIYVALAASWALLVFLAISTGMLGHRDKDNLFDSWTYFCSQPGVILAHYVPLCFWPHPLCLVNSLDFNFDLNIAWKEVLLSMLAMGAIIGVCVWGFVKRKVWGFLGICFVLILAPTSSFLPLAQLVFEHRLYLPLAAVVALVVGGTIIASQAIAKRGWAPPLVLGCCQACLLLACALVLSGLTFNRNEDYKTAISIWRDSVEKQPDNCDARNNLGKALAAAGDIPEALIQFQKAIDINPDMADARCNLGSSLLNLGQVDKALEQLRIALEIKPELALANVNLGRAMSRQGRLDEAGKLLAKAIEIEPDNAAAYIQRGLIKVKQNRFDEAQEDFTKALDLKPGYPDALNNMATMLMIKGNLDEAIELYQKAVASPSNPADANSNINLAEMRYNLGSALQRKGIFKEAVQEWQEALKIKPDYIEVYFSLAECLASQGNLDDAIAIYHKVLEIKPGTAEAHNNLGNVYRNMGRIDEAIEQYEIALSIKPDLVKAHYSLANILGEKGQIDEAIAHLRKTLEIDPRHAEAHYHLGRALHILEKIDEALAEYQKALEIAPNFADAHFNIGAVLYQQNHIPEALGHWRIGNRLQPNKLFYLLATARALATNPDPAMRDGKEAVGLALRAVNIDGRKTPIPFDTLAAAYAETGAYTEAVAAAKEALGLVSKANGDLSKTILARIDLYEHQKPLREEPPALDVLIQTIQGN